VIVGFANIDDSGYLGSLYVHKDFQRRGIGTALCDAAEQAVGFSKYTLHSSVTARRFYALRGNPFVERQTMDRKSQYITIIVMEKEV